MAHGSADADRRLDVRAVEGEPFEDIMSALDDLPPGESLLLVNSFEPEPLYGVLDGRGYDYETSNPEEGLWYVEIEHA